MTGFDTVNLAYLIHHYGDAYRINMQNRRFVATRRDDGSVIRTDTAELMLAELRADYAARPVPRDC